MREGNGLKKFPKSNRPRYIYLTHCRSDRSKIFGGTEVYNCSVKSGSVRPSNFQSSCLRGKNEINLYGSVRPMGEWFGQTETHTEGFKVQP